MRPPGEGGEVSRGESKALVLSRLADCVASGTFHHLPPNLNEVSPFAALCPTWRHILLDKPLPLPHCIANMAQADL